jgi:putative ABC transport system substrate-binding protein
MKLTRRQLAAALGSAAAWPLAARGQQGDRVRRLGILMNVAKEDPAGIADLVAFRMALAELNWIEGRNIQIETRWPGSDIERIAALAKELVELKPDVLLARSTPTTAALRHEISTAPIVFVNVTEPVEQGFVQSLARPGGNVTGFSNFEPAITGKWLQLLKEADPRIARVALVHNPQTAPFAGTFVRSAQSSASAFRLEVTAMPVQSDADIEAAMNAFAQRPGGALVAIPDSFNAAHRDAIISQAARNRLPTLYAVTASAPAGGLMAYAVDTTDLMRRAASYVDRIFKGTKPGELPVQFPAKFDFAINLKTARALGLQIPQGLLATADELIE